MESLFSPRWYRVAGIHPRLRSHVRVSRHVYRDQVWYLLQDQSSGRHHRVDETAFHFIGRMDGKRSTDEIWHSLLNQLRESTPTQDDTIDWKLESVAFYAMTPDGMCPALSVLPRSPYLCTETTTPAARDCPAGQYPIYRAFDVGPASTRPDPNHQFTASWIDIYRNVRFSGYVYEGVAFCAPVSSQPWCANTP